MDGVYSFPRRLEHPVLDGLHIALDVGRRGAQLVGDVGSEAAAAALRLLQLFFRGRSRL